MASPETGATFITLEPPAHPLSLQPYGVPASAAASDVVNAATFVPLLGSHVDATIDWAATSTVNAPASGCGRTREAWEVLASAAATDVTGARIMEPMLDARNILSEARASGDEPDLAAIGADEESTWGVYAAEGARLEAVEDAGTWRLTGKKDWCSLANHLSHALITAWTGPNSRRLFAVSLRRPEVKPARGPWVARGLSQIVSASVDFDGAPAVPIGEDEWYFRRPGFSWGGIGVAAVWWGACAPLVRRVVERARAEGSDQIAHMLAGDADTAFWAMRAVLAEAADAIDAGIGGLDLRITTARARSIVASHSEHVLALSDRALGPGPLTTDEKHARRVSDLRIYLRQHHGERDLARIGKLLSTA
jgi:alkylation response protein AidB-like acyl-CoA dehydrogenase